MGWTQYLDEIKKDPRNFARAMIDHLRPPKYVIKQLRSFEWLCGWSQCWKPRIDICFNCGSSVCEEHSKMEIGPKTGLEWYICQACQNTVPKEELMAKILAEDEEFWLEDQEDEAPAGEEVKN